MEDCDLAISLSNRVTVPENVLFRELEGESVILNVDSETYFGLDDVGTRMWIELIDTETVQEAFDTLRTQYDTAPDRLCLDLIKLVEKLIENGLMEIADATPSAEG